jgi:hypothetical protein
MEFDVCFWAAKVFDVRPREFVPPGQSYPIWSPYDSYGAAVLLECLKAEKASR